MSGCTGCGRGPGRPADIASAPIPIGPSASPGPLLALPCPALCLYSCHSRALACSLAALVWDLAVSHVARTPTVVQTAKMTNAVMRIEGLTRSV